MNWPVHLTIYGVVFSCQAELCLAVVLVFCSEGDNIPDAFTLVNHLNDWLLLVDNNVSAQRTEFQRC